MNFNDLKIRRKILLMTSGIAILSSLSGVFVYNVIKEVNVHLKELVENDLMFNQTIEKIEVETLTLRRNEKDFLLNIGNDETQAEYLTKFDETGEKLKGNLKTISDAVVSDQHLKNDPEVAKANEGLLPNLNNYLTSVHSIFKDISANPKITPQEGNKKLSDEAKESIHQLLNNAKILKEKGLAMMKATSNETVKDSEQAIIKMIIAVIAVLVLSVIIGIVFSQLFVKPIQEMVGMLKDISEGEGDLTKRLKVNSKDEMGDLSKYFNLFVEKIQKTIAQIASNANTVASSATELSAISTQFGSAVKTVSQRTTGTAAAAEESSANIMSVAVNMKQATASLTSVANATEEMSSTIAEIAHNSEKARAISIDAETQAANVSITMNKLGESAQEIGKVTEVITKISTQTNLLALNATIEAARAGDAGKSFAVVANAIKELAKQTSQATDEIKSNINGVQTNVNSSIADIEKVANIIGQVRLIVTGIATAIEEQSAVTKDIAGNISQASIDVVAANENVNQTATVSSEIAKGIAEIDATTTEIGSSGNQIQSSSAELSKLAEELRRLVGQFKITDSKQYIG